MCQLQQFRKRIGSKYLMLSNQLVIFGSRVADKTRGWFIGVGLSDPQYFNILKGVVGNIYPRGGRVLAQIGRRQSFHWPRCPCCLTFYTGIESGSGLLKRKRLHYQQAISFCLSFPKILPICRTYKCYKHDYCKPHKNKG